MTTYMTTEEVAELCRTSAETVRYWRHTQRGPSSFKLGRRVLYARNDVESWIEEQQRTSRTAPAPMNFYEMR